MRVKVGDKLRCKQTLTNVFGRPLFIKDDVYDVLGVYNDEIILKHILYGSEYADFSLDFVKRYFITLKEERKLKLKNINEHNL